MVCYRLALPRSLISFPTRRSSDLLLRAVRVGPGLHDPGPGEWSGGDEGQAHSGAAAHAGAALPVRNLLRQESEEHTSELQSPDHLVCRLLLEKKKFGWS